MTSASSPDSPVFSDIEQFSSLLQQHGIHTALQYLNSRTPHRYTGVFRFDGDLLRNEALYDRRDPVHVVHGFDTPLEASYCILLTRQQLPLEITNADIDPRLDHLTNKPASSYCGVLIRDNEGKPFGSLCHFDTQRCQERTTDLQLMEAAASLLYDHLHSPEPK